MATPNLNITHIVTAQAQKEVTANEAFDALDTALCGQLSLDFTSGNVALSDAQFRGSIAFRAANLSVARDLTVPAIKRLFVVSNKDGTATLTVKRGATSVAIASGKLALLYTDGTTDGLFAAAADSGAGAAQPYDIASFYPGVPGSSQLLLRFAASRSVTLPSGLTGSCASAGVAATAQTDIDIQVGGVSKGTVRFAAAATTATFIFASQVVLAAGDALTLVAPSSPDATLADIAITLAGTR